MWQSVQAGRSEGRAILDEQELLRTDSMRLAARLGLEYQHCREVGLPLAIMLCAPDAVGRIREAIGPGPAEELLGAIVNRAGKYLLPSDWVWHFGSGRCLMVLPGEIAASALAVAQNIRRYVAGLGPSVIVPFSVSISIGIACVRGAAPMGDENVSTLLFSAKERLERARFGGGDRVIADDLDAAAAG